MAHSDPYIKAIPDEKTGKLRFEMDQAGFEYFSRLIARSNPRKGDNIASFHQVKDRIQGTFMAGGVIMGWYKNG